MICVLVLAREIPSSKPEYFALISATLRWPTLAGISEIWKPKHRKDFEYGPRHESDRFLNVQESSKDGGSVPKSDRQSGRQQRRRQQREPTQRESTTFEVRYTFKLRFPFINFKKYWRSIGRWLLFESLTEMSRG